MHNVMTLQVVDVKEAVEEVMRAMFGRVLLQITQIIDQIEYESVTGIVVSAAVV